MENIRIDFNNMFCPPLDSGHGVKESELDDTRDSASLAHQHLSKVISDSASRPKLGLEWTQLPYQDKAKLSEIKSLGREIAGKYSDVIFLGIGGSYLGLRAAQDALAMPYANEFCAKGPRVYFDGNNLDPETTSALLKNLKPKKTFVVAISKSGETTETKAAFFVLEDWLRKAIGKNYGRQIAVITDPDSGALRKRVNDEQEKDKFSFRSLPLYKGVGGRYSEFNMGLLHLAIIGANIEEILAGARAMAKRCSRDKVYENPALMYAALQTILYRKKGKDIAILMPFCQALKSTADWYVQLLAESLGKKYSRKIKLGPASHEEWLSDQDNIVNIGRTPIASCGTNDLHSIQQNNIEGKNNKAITFIKVGKFKSELRVPGKADILSGKSYSSLISLAQEATEWALVRQDRPSCTVVMPEVSAYHWGELIYFFEMATAYEGELLNVNAFDQPGVEGYKNYMYYKLGKPGIAGNIVKEIENNPLVKNSKFIL